MKRLFVAGLLLALMPTTSARPVHVEKQAAKSVLAQIFAPVLPGTGPEYASNYARVVSHPIGCPHIAFCACGAAVRIFGKPIKELWAAVRWFKFPRTQPAPNMVAVRRHHVFVLLRQIQGPIWLVYDANARRHLTLVHARSIAGWTIVNPGAA